MSFADKINQCLDAKLNDSNKRSKIKVPRNFITLGRGLISFILVTVDALC